MLNQLRNSLKTKAFIILIIFGITPLIILGTVTTSITTGILERQVNYMAAQTIKALSISINEELKRLIDMTFYHSKNKRLIDLLEECKSEENNWKLTNQAVRNELFQSDLIRRINYPFHYFVITEENDIFSDNFVVSDSKTRQILDVIGKSEWYIRLMNSFSGEVAIGTNSQLLLEKGGDQIYFSANIINTEENMENVGTIIVGVSEYYVTKLLRDIKIGDRNSLYIINQRGECLIESEGNSFPYSMLPETFIQKVTAPSKEVKVMEVLEERQLVLSHNLSLQGSMDTLKLVMISPVDDIYSDIKYIKYVTALLIAVSSFMVLFLIYIVNRNILEPVIRLSSITNQVRAGNLDVEFKGGRKDEIGQLADNFNVMVRDLKKYIIDIKQKEQLKRRLEIRLLQSQMKPHFIRNTLNTIRWMAEMKRAYGISKAVTSFSCMLDYTLDENSQGDNLVTVRDEMSYLEEYIYLQQLRYQNKFTSSFSIDNNIMDMKILKLCFQPIVENSIAHGFQYKQGTGNLTIKGFREGDMLVFIIEDDGIGMDEMKAESFLKDSPAVTDAKEGMALYNIHRRLKMYYGEIFGLIIESSPGNGTRVKMVFPV